MNEVVIDANRLQPQVLSVPDTRIKTNLRIETLTLGHAVVVYCSGRIVYRDEALALSAKIAELVLHTKEIIIGLGAVEMIDSAGLGELVLVLTRSQAHGCAVKLAGPRKIVRHLLEITNLASVFEIYPSVEDALVSGRCQPV